MTFYWTEEKLELYKRAAEYTDFNRGLAEVILSIIGEDRVIYDIGCGLSYLAMNMSEKSKEINCIDIDSKAIEILNREIEKKNIKNIYTINNDFKKVLDKVNKVDCIIASHFLDMNENLEYLLSKSKLLIIIKNTKNVDGIYIGKKQRIEDVEEILRKRDYKYSKRDYSGEFGQPLKTIEEGVDYYNSYCKNQIGKDNLKTMLFKGNMEEYPYYLPKYKKLGLLFVEREYYE